MQDPDWQPTTILRGLDDVRRLKATAGSDIVCTGSIDLTHQLVAADLVDEYRLFVYPTVVAAGRRLFPNGSPQTLTLSNCTRFESGVALLTYRSTAQGANS
ncbi:dihydrofolate reductase family protein [Kribbella sp. NPDC000426]|uniref:dihydrofolate reductase family protein n=1 Tax=Kribbella sp. NPDC000426 TaxID=3154255 RepID=UPI003329C6BD